MSTAGVFAVASPCWNKTAEMELGAVADVGAYDDRGRFARDDVPSIDITLRVGGAVRLPVDDFQLYTRIPLRGQFRHSETGLEFGGGVPEVEFGAQWTVLRDPGTGPVRGLRPTFYPFVDLYAHGVVPVEQWAARPADGEEFVGNATAAVATGARITKFVTARDGVRLGGGVEVPIASRSAGGGIRRHNRGVTTELRLTYHRVHSMVFSWGISAAAHRSQHTEAFFSRSQPSRVGAELAAHLQYVVGYPHWAVVADVSTDWFGPVGGFNRPSAGPAVTVGLERRFQ